MAWSSSGDPARVGDCSWPALVILWRCCAFPGGAPKATLVNYSCHWATSLVGRFLRCPHVGQGSCYTSAVEPQVLVDTTGTSVPASTWTSRENSCVHLVINWYSPSGWSSCWLIGPSPLRRYKDFIFSFTFPQNSVISSLVYLACVAYLVLVAHLV
jgi:hypothetical protein